MLKHDLKHENENPYLHLPCLLNILIIHPLPVKIYLDASIVQSRKEKMLSIWFLAIDNNFLTAQYKHYFSLQPNDGGYERSGHVFNTTQTVNKDLFGS